MAEKNFEKNIDLNFLLARPKYLLYIGLFFAVLLAGCPQYNVYSSKLAGQAKLVEAESSRKIAIVEADARKEAAQSLAEGEIIRARGVAEANRIIGDSLKNNEAYLRYLYINNLNDASNKNNSVIYIPTEAGLPVLEAGKRK